MMGERDAAQAAELIRALSEVRDKMISQINWLEKHEGGQTPQRYGETSTKLRPTSLICTTAT